MPQKMPAKRLAAVAEECRELYKQVQNGFAAALKLGHKLKGIRQRMPHGSWEKWVEANLPFTPRRARQFISLAENEEAIRNRGSDFSVRKAIQAITIHLEPPESGEPLKPTGMWTPGPRVTADTPSEPVELHGSAALIATGLESKFKDVTFEKTPPDLSAGIIKGDGPVRLVSAPPRPEPVVVDIASARYSPSKLDSYAASITRSAEHLLKYLQMTTPLLVRQAKEIHPERRATLIKALREAGHHALNIADALAADTEPHHPPP
jgi:hypothetical protein